MIKIISSVLFLIFISLFCAGIIWDKKGFRIERPARAVGVFLFIVGVTIVGVDIERKAYDEAYSNAFVDQKKKQKISGRKSRLLMIAKDAFMKAEDVVILIGIPNFTKNANFKN